MKMLGALRGERGEERDWALSLDEYIHAVTFAQNNYLLTGQTTYGTNEERVEEGYLGYVRGAYKRNGVVFACILARQLLFMEARFQYRRFDKGRPGEFFGDKSLRLLEKPEPGKTTAWLLAKAEQDVSLAGNWYAARRNGRIKRMRPDWVTVVVGSFDDAEVYHDDLDAEVIGYLYHPGGRSSGRKPMALLASEVCHYAPIPDPEASYRGMSWLQPVIAEIQADQSATSHKQRFFDKGATPNLIVKFDPKVKAADFQEWVKLFREEHEGVDNAYKTLFLGAGADAQVVGANLRQIAFKETQGAGETRIAGAAGVPPIIVGLSEGLAAATYSNYGQARRRFSDLTMRPLWRSFASAMETLVPPPSGSQLWYDDRDIPFLQEDERDSADIFLVQSSAARMLIDGGFSAESVIKALAAGDVALLEHSGLVSVQLQAPGSAPATNGNGVSPVEASARLLEAIESARTRRELPRSIDP